MSSKVILIVSGDPKSIFFEIFFKSLKKISIKSPIILISSKALLEKQMKIFKFKKKIKLLDEDKVEKYNLDNKKINLIDIKFKRRKDKYLEQLSNSSNQFIKSSLDIAFKILKRGKVYKFINGPISKKNFLNQKYLGMTEYISSHFSVKNSAMLIYNKELAVCPLTTHLPLKLVTKNINEKKIEKTVKLISKFYEEKFLFKPKIAILGLNPHCETIEKFNEDEKIIRPLVQKLYKKKYKIYGPYSADTIFLKDNRKKYNVIIGMYHDQVLTPIKTLYEFDAINITLGLPFIRVSPDHGPNQNMIGRNLSNPLSLIKAIKFLDKN